MLSTGNQIQLPSLKLSNIKPKLSQTNFRGENKNVSFRDISESISKTFHNEIGKRTDDLNFADNELKNISRKNEKKSLNKIKIWEKPSTANLEKDINIRKKIQELRKTCREATGFNSSDLKNMKFLNKTNVDSIVETSKIINDKNTQKLNFPLKQESIFSFVTDNREICMKNFLLGLLKEERSLINAKESLVARALKDSDVKLEKDYKNFVEFIENEKKIQKNNEIVLIKAFDANKDLAVKKKKINQENKQICDDIDRTIKGILALKSYAGFVHIVLGDTNIKFHFDKSMLENRNMEQFEILIKDKDLDKTMESILNEFKDIDLDKNNPIRNLLNDHSTMTLKFQEFEENILKLMDNKQVIDKEYERIKLENEIELKKLTETENLMRLELSKLVHEKDKDGKIISELRKNSNVYGTNYEISKMIYELFAATKLGDDIDQQTFKKIKGKKETDCIKEIMETLRKIEFQIIEYIDDLEQVSKTDEAKFRSIVNSRKEDNKKKKQQAQKIKSEGEKAEERMHRVVIKGRKVMEHKLVGKGSKKRYENLNINKGNDDFNMLYYESNEDF